VGWRDTRREDDVLVIRVPLRVFARQIAARALEKI
jgi:hypothetical protein